MKARFLIVLAALILVPYSASAIEVELRAKGGRVPGIDTMTIENPFIDATGNGDSGGNVQMEVAIAPLRSRITPVFNVGFFSRSHSGTVSDPFASVDPTKVEYDAAGLILGAGARFRINRNFHVDAKLELGLGSGDITLTTPGFLWNQTRDLGYASTSLLVGGYYTFSKPGLQLGVEAGVQGFGADFEIWNNAGFWTEGTVEGGGGVINMVVGFRF